MPEYGNEKADICLKDREQMSAFWMKRILVLYKCSQTYKKTKETKCRTRKGENT